MSKESALVEIAAGIIKTIIVGIGMIASRLSSILFGVDYKKKWQ